MCRGAFTTSSWFVAPGAESPAASVCVQRGVWHEAQDTASGASENACITATRFGAAEEHGIVTHNRSQVPHVLRLDIPKHTSSEGVLQQEYTLSAVIYHRGASANAGHYIADVFDPVRSLSITVAVLCCR